MKLLSVWPSQKFINSLSLQYGGTIFTGRGGYGGRGGRGGGGFGGGRGGGGRGGFDRDRGMLMVLVLSNLFVVKQQACIYLIDGEVICEKSNRRYWFVHPKA